MSTVVAKGVPPQRIEIDVSDIDRQIWLLRFADVLIIGAGWLVSISILWQVVGGKIPLDWLSAPLAAVALLLPIPAWRSLGKVEVSRWRVYLLAVRLYLALAIAVTAAGLVIVYVLRSAETSAALLTGMQALFGHRVVGHAAFDMFAIGSLIAVYCLSALLRARVGPGFVPLANVLAGFEEGYAHTPSRRAVPISSRLRSVAAGMGAAALYTFPVLPGLGPALLLYARRFAQAEADELLKLDDRKPVLFLRSFHADLIDDLHAGSTVMTGMALEPRLARHFASVGPFVAIGDPREAVPKLGAARAKRDGDEWRVTVKEWMAAAQVIVLIAGATKSVLWELQQCIGGGFATKLIILFDEPVPWSNEQRLANIRQAFEGSRWQSALDGLGPAARLRAIRFSDDGNILRVVSSTTYHTEAAHVAAIVAHDAIRNAMHSA